MTEGRETDISHDTDSTPRSTRWRRRLVALLLVLVLLPFFVLAGVYFALRSPLLESWVWPKLQPVIAEKSGFQVELKKLRIDLLAGVNLEGLAVQQLGGESGVGCDNLQVTLESFVVDFRALALLQKQLHVDLFAVRGLDVSGCMTLKPGEEAEKPPAGDPQAQLEQLFAQIAEPPLEVHLHKVEIERVQADVEFRNPHEGMHMAWNGRWDLTTSLHWEKNRLTGAMNTTLASLAPMRMNRGSEEEGMAVRLTPQVEADLGWSLQQGEGSRHLVLKPFDAMFALDDFSAAMTTPAQKLSLAFPAYRFESGKGGNLHLTLEENWPLQLDLEMSSRLAEAEVDMVKAGLGHLRTRFAHGMNVTAAGEVDVRVPTLDRLVVDVSGEQRLHDLLLQPPADAPSPKATRLADARWLLRAGSVDSTARGDLVATMDLQVEKADAPQLLRAVDLHPHMALRVKRDLSEAGFTARVVLDDIELMSADIGIRNRPEELELRPRMTARIPQRLAKLSQAAESLNRMGDLEMAAEGSATWKHGQPVLAEADFKTLDTWQLGAELAMTLTQTKKPRAEDGLKLTGPLTAQMQVDSRRPEGLHDITVSFASDGVQQPPLLKPLPLEGEFRTQLDEALTQVAQEGQMRFDRRDFLDWRFTLANKPGLADIAGHLRMQATPKWKKYIAGFEGLEKFGDMDTGNDFTVTIAHPYESIKEIDPKNLDVLKVAFDLDGTLAQTRPSSTAPVHMAEPLRYKQELLWSTADFSTEGEYRLPRMASPDGIMAGRGLGIGFTAKGAPGMKPSSVEATFNLSLDHLRQAGTTVVGFSMDGDMQVAMGEEIAQHAEIRVDAEGVTLESQKPGQEAQTMEVAGLAFPMVMKAQTAFDPVARTVALQNIEWSVGNGWLDQYLFGEVALETQTALLNGLVVMKPRDGMMADLKASGEMMLPWQLNMVDGKHLLLSARADFTDFSMNLPDAGVSGINGQLSIEEDLEIREKNRIAFSYLLTPDAFQRVDFARVEPYLQNQRDFRIDEMRAGDLTVSRLQATLPVRQNQIRLQHFSMHMLDGVMAGQFYVDTTPGAWRVGMHGMMTGIDLRRMLPDSPANTEYAPISARTAVEFDLHRRLLEGRMDITDITRAQLLQLFDVMDPDHRDPKLSNARSALRLAHPEWVSFDMRQGLMDMSMGLSLFSDPLHVRGLPLSPIIERFGENALAIPDSLPLE